MALNFFNHLSWVQLYEFMLEISLSGPAIGPGTFSFAEILDYAGVLVPKGPLLGPQIQTSHHPWPLSESKIDPTVV